MLFAEGRELASQQRWAEACERFRASEEAERALGTLLNLADCYEQQGRIASAWERFREAEAWARDSGQKVREQVAQQRAAALEARLSRVRVEGAADLLGPHGELRIAGRAIDPSRWAAGVPVDSGVVEVALLLPDEPPRTLALEVPPGAQLLTFDLGVLGRPAAEASPPTVSPEPLGPEPRVTHQVARGRGWQRGLAWTGAGVAAASLAVSAGFGAHAAGRWSEAKRHCQGTVCDPEGGRLAGEANTSADVATGTLVAGGVAAAAALVLFLVPSGDEVALAPVLGSQTVGLAVGGRF